MLFIISRLCSPLSLFFQTRPFLPLFSSHLKHLIPSDQLIDLLIDNIFLLDIRLHTNETIFLLTLPRNAQRTHSMAPLTEEILLIVFRAEIHADIAANILINLLFRQKVSFHYYYTPSASQIYERIGEIKRWGMGGYAFLVNFIDCYFDCRGKS
jgi:hypothetical protein